MSTNKERFAAFLEVVEFAQSKGFDVSHAYWDGEDPENGYTDLSEALCDADPGVHELQVGLYLDNIRFVKTAIPEDADTDAEETFEPAEGEAP